MRKHSGLTRQRSTVFVALLLFGMVLVVLQLWLFVSVLENAIHGEMPSSKVAAAISVGLFLVNVWMVRALSHLGRSD